MGPIIQNTLDTFWGIIFPQPIGFIAIFIILFLILRTWKIISSINQAIDREESTIRQFAKIVRDFNGISEDEKEEINDLSEVLRDKLPVSLLSEAILNLSSIKGLPNPNIETIIRIMPNNLLPSAVTLRSMPNVLLLVGLMGTVIGLAGSVASLAPQLRDALENIDRAGLTQSLSGTLREMRTAFSATFWGIISSLVTNFFIQRVLIRQSKVLQEIKKLIIQEIAPQILPRSVEAQIKDIRKVLQDSRKQMQKVSALMSESASSFETILGKTGDVMGQNIKELSTVSSSMQSALSVVSDDIKQSAESLNEGTKGVKKSTDQLREYHNNLSNAYTRMGDYFEEARKFLELQSKEQLESAKSMQTQFGEATNAVINVLQGSTDTTKEASIKFDQAGKDYLRANNSLFQKVDTQFENLHEKLQHTFKLHNKELLSVENVLRDIEREMNDLVTRINPSLSPKDQINEFSLMVRKIADMTENIKMLLETNVPKTLQPDQL